MSATRFYSALCLAVLLAGALLLSAAPRAARCADTPPPRAATALDVAASSLLVEGELMPQDLLIRIGNAGGMCALTFDDGPGRYTPQLLRILRERGIRATFFLVGSQVSQHPFIARSIAEAGHEIGNHSNTHKAFRNLTPRGQRLEIVKMQRMLANLGIECRLLRPPYGKFNAHTLDIAARQGLTTVLWTVDTQDWMHKLSIAGMVSTRGHDRPTRGVFLMHDIHAGTINALPALLDYLQASGCRFVTVSEYLGGETPPLRPIPSYGLLRDESGRLLPSGPARLAQEKP